MVDMAYTFSYLLTKYRSQNCTEEAAIVDKLIFEEEVDAVRKHDGIISDRSGLQRKYTLRLDY
jgi:hypothetical protein